MVEKSFIYDNVTLLISYFNHCSVCTRHLSHSVNLKQSIVHTKHLTLPTNDLIKNKFICDAMPSYST